MAAPKQRQLLDEGKVFLGIAVRAENRNGAVDRSEVRLIGIGPKEADDVTKTCSRSYAEQAAAKKNISALIGRNHNQLVTHGVGQNPEDIYVQYH